MTHGLFVERVDLSTAELFGKGLHGRFNLVMVRMIMMGVVTMIVL